MPSESERQLNAKILNELQLYGLAYQEILRDVSHFLQSLEDATPRMASVQKRAIAAYKPPEMSGLELPDLHGKMKNLLADGRQFHTSLDEFRTSLMEFALRLYPEMDQPEED